MFRRSLLLAGFVLCACTPQSPTAPASPAPQAPSPVASAETPAPAIAVVYAIAEGARLTSPVQVMGSAPANWYFENQFPVKLVNAAGEEIAAAPAHPEVNWTDPDPVKKFEATLTFNVTAETPATLVLEQDMPGQDAAGEDLPPLTTRIPVVLVPAH
jgi:hypothetical protein